MSVICGLTVLASDGGHGVLVCGALCFLPAALGLALTSMLSEAGPHTSTVARSARDHVTSGGVMVPSTTNGHCFFHIFFFQLLPNGELRLFCVLTREKEGVYSWKQAKNLLSPTA